MWESDLVDMLDRNFDDAVLEQVHFGAEIALDHDVLARHRADGVARHAQNKLRHHRLARAFEQVAALQRARKQARDDARLHLFREVVEEVLLKVDVSAQSRHRCHAAALPSRVSKCKMLFPFPELLFVFLWDGAGSYGLE